MLFLHKLHNFLLLCFIFPHSYCHWFISSKWCFSIRGSVQFSSVSHVWLFVTPWITACRASLSITNSRSLLKLMSIESVMPSNHLILCHPLLLLPSIFPSIRAFQMSQLFTWGGQSIGVSVSTSVLPVNTQDWSPLGLVWSPCSPRDSQESSPTPQFKSINSSVLNFLYSPTLTSIYRESNFVLLGTFANVWRCFRFSGVYRWCYQHLMQWV